MTEETLSTLIRCAGAGQLSVLAASALVPFRLDWKRELAGLKRLQRQMYWVYGGYIVLSIVAFGVLSLAFPSELASGSGLARGMCAFVAVFWGIRLCLQPVFDVSEHLTTWWLKTGYHLLSLLFLALTLIFGYAAMR